MELGLSLGDPPKPFGFLEKHQRENDNKSSAFCMDLSIGPSRTGEEGGGRAKEQEEPEELKEKEQQGIRNDVVCIAQIENVIGNDNKPGSSPPVQLDLLPLSPVPRTTTTTTHGFPWSSSPADTAERGSGGLELNRIPKITAAAAAAEEAAAEEGSSPNSNSGASSFPMEMCLYSSGNKNNGNNNNYKRDQYISEGEGERNSNSRASDEDEANGANRKKLRLSKDQSAFLEESFKEHNTLNPKQKIALAKQLNLRPRQVEVWFQNRRARTKLKQTEVDCEYLKRCCETLTEENRRLHKELQELRALKTSNPFYMQLPATTLTMCPSCERVATTTTATTTAAAATNTSTNSNNTKDSKAVGGFPLNRPKFYPFSHAQTT
ncbi:Homeobox-leucine zipper protein HAT14 [Morus notabilis]|uniref:Homeobox-leucine zipper protein HAT14 n=1 Tax=Morus notabilis TaxID=981085 RepID=W9T1Y5_9ROSA|nr:homeobox-leucine zipper protein HOX11 [Morus notabilis]EXC42166.1 Homeobox-leucine zipper protein HAT14 [Morus notabilis]